MSIAATSPAPPRGDGPVRVMVVDDAVVVRGLISRWLEEAGGFEVVARHRTGALAVADMERANPDVVILDIEMPDMDGIEALPLILKKKRNCAVIMASTLTRRNAEISLRCLSLGALDYVPKPESNRDITTSIEFRREIVEKVTPTRPPRRSGRPPAPRCARRAVSPRPRPRLRAGSEKGGFRAEQAAPPRRGGFLAKERGCQRARASGPVSSCAPSPPCPPRILLIGSSTGGPQALNTVICGIAPLIDRVPVLITQHMPATFTTILAEHLGRACGARPRPRPCTASRSGPAASMSLRADATCWCGGAKGHAVLVLDDGPPVNFCKPAVDPMFASAAQVFGAAVMAVVLTGHGLGRRAWRRRGRLRRAAASSPRTRRRASSGACRAPWRRPAIARPCCPSTRSHRS